MWFTVNLTRQFATARLPELGHFRQIGSGVIAPNRTLNWPCISLKLQGGPVTIVNFVQAITSKDLVILFCLFKLPTSRI